MPFLKVNGKYVLLDLTVEQTVGPLIRVKCRCCPKQFHVLWRVIAHANGSNLALPIKQRHGFGGFFYRDKRIRPVNLVDVDITCPETPQRILDFTQDALA